MHHTWQDDPGTAVLCNEYLYLGKDLKGKEMVDWIEIQHHLYMEVLLRFHLFPVRVSSFSVMQDDG